MGTKIKGLIKGLRYISNMFDAKEQDMQIGYPTDVKHVAHIGWDGPSVGGTIWMNDFCSAPLTATNYGDRTEVPHFPSSELIGEMSPRQGPKPLEKPSRRKKPLEKSTHRTSEESKKKESSSCKHSYRDNSSSSEPSESSRRSRRESRVRSSDTSSRRGGGENQSSENELPGIPKQPHRRKCKGSSTSSGGSGSKRSSVSTSQVNTSKCESQNEDLQV